MDVVRSLSQANVILPAGDVQIGNLDYNIYSNAQFNLKDANQYPIKMNGENPVLMSDVGQLKDAHALQYNVVHVNGQRSVYLPVMKQGGDSNTIAVVDGVRKTVSHLVDVPPAMKTDVVFDQSRFVRTAIETLLRRRWNRPVPHLRDDPDVPGKLAGDTGGLFFHSAVGVRHILRSATGRIVHQQHGAGRAGAGVIAA